MCEVRRAAAMGRMVLLGWRIGSYTMFSLAILTVQHVTSATVLAFK